MQRGILGLILIVIALGWAAAPLGGAAAAAPAVRAEQVGSQVRVTGEAPPHSEVALVVLRSGGVPVHADQTTADADGVYLFAWRPSGWSADTYEARVTGDGLEAAMSAYLAYVPTSGSGGDPDGFPGGGQEQAADASGSGEARATPTERGVRIQLGSEEQLPDGLLIDAVRMLNSLSADARQAGEIAIERPGEASGEGGVELPARELLEAVPEELAQRTTVVVRLGPVEYSLPMDVLLDAARTWQEEAANPGGPADAGGWRLRIDIRKAASDEAPGWPGMQLLSEVYRFEIRAAGLPSDAEWKRFNGRYATRALPLQRLPASGYAAGYYWEEGMAEPAFVPLRAEERNGVLYAVMTRAGNSVYFVAESEAPALTDIAGHWAEPTLRKLAAQRLVNGMPDGAYRPDAPMTRAQFATLLARATALTPSSPAASESGFADVRSGDWYGGAVSAVVSQGWMVGYGDGRFGPDGTLTRQEAAVALLHVWRQAGVFAPTSTGELRFADRQRIAPWAAEAVAALADLGVLQGTPDGRFQPERPLTRAEAASVLARLLEALGWTDGQAGQG